MGESKSKPKHEVAEDPTSEEKESVVQTEGQETKEEDGKKESERSVSFKNMAKEEGEQTPVSKKKSKKKKKKKKKKRREAEMIAEEENGFVAFWVSLCTFSYSDDDEGNTNN